MQLGLQCSMSDASGIVTICLLILSKTVKSESCTRLAELPEVWKARTLLNGNLGMVGWFSVRWTVLKLTSGRLARRYSEAIHFSRSLSLKLTSAIRPREDSADHRNSGDRKRLKDSTFSQNWPKVLIVRDHLIWASAAADLRRSWSYSSGVDPNGWVASLPIERKDKESGKCARTESWVDCIPLYNELWIRRRECQGRSKADLTLSAES
jgi:hypothetical protein